MSIRDYLIRRQVKKMHKSSKERIEGLNNFVKYLSETEEKDKEEVEK
jgi:hypothetical protein